MRFKITVKTFNGVLLHYIVEEYKIDGPFVFFIDSKTGLKKIFPCNNCEIEEINYGN